MSTYYIRDMYELRFDNAYIKPSTSADGWKYHKPNKKCKKNKR